MAEVSQGGKRKTMSGGNGDTRRRHARKRADRAVCGRVISCSRGQEWWRTELELCGGESFDDGHRSAALGATPQRRTQFNEMDARISPDGRWLAYVSDESG